MAGIEITRNRARLAHYGFLSALGSAVSVLLAAALLTIFAPLRLGGSMTLLVVNGTSMEPGMHTGDFVFVSNQRLPQVGEVAAYRSPTLGVVIHRVIEDDGTRFTFLGDNRTTTDPDQPTREQIVGRLVLHIPNAMRYFRLAVDPKMIGMMSGMIIVIGMIKSPAVVRRKAPQNPFSHRRRTMTSGLKQLSVWNPMGRQLASLAITAILASAVVFLLVMRTGYTESSTKVVGISERGALNYSSTDVPPGLYENDRLSTSQPIIRHTTRQFDVEYDYALSPKDVAIDPGSVSGKYSMIVQLNHDTGWHREFVLTPATPFAGDALHAVAPLDLSRLDDLASRFEEALQLADGLTAYTVRVVVNLDAAGTASGQPFVRQISQAIQFNMTNRVIALDREAKNTALVLTSTPTVKLSGQADRFLNIPIVHRTVTYRQLVPIARTALAVGTVLLAAVLLATAIIRHAKERELIPVRYRDLVVDVTGQDFLPTTDVVFVRRFDDLTRIALLGSVAVMHFAGAKTDLYAVQTATQTFAYQTGADHENRFGAAANSGKVTTP